MAKTAFDMMMQGIRDAIGYVAGDASRGRDATRIDPKANAGSQPAGKRRKQCP